MVSIPILSYFQNHVLKVKLDIILIINRLMPLQTWPIITIKNLYSNAYSSQQKSTECVGPVELHLATLAGTQKLRQATRSISMMMIILPIFANRYQRVIYQKCVSKSIKTYILINIQLPNVCGCIMIRQQRDRKYFTKYSVHLLQ